MSINYINIGSSANKGDGDTLRTAFRKINENFAYLSTATGYFNTGSSTVLNIAENAPSTADGTLWFNTQDARTYVRYNGAWVDASPQITPPPTTGTEAIITVGPLPPSTGEGSLWFNENDARTYINYGGAWIDSSPQVTPPPTLPADGVGVLANDGQGNLYWTTASVTTATVDFLNVGSNILPSSDLTYDLGSPTKQWRSLYVGTSTIYFGGVPITVSTGGNTLVIGTGTESVNLASEDYVLEQLQGIPTSQSFIGFGNFTVTSSDTNNFVIAGTGVSTSTVTTNFRIHGSVGGQGPGADPDYVKITTGSEPISAIYLTKYVSTDNRAFFAIQEGNQWTAPQNQVTDAMVAYSHFGRSGVVVGGNLLNGFGPLAPNTTYTFWIQQIGAAVTEYVFSTDPSDTGGVSSTFYSRDALNPSTVFPTTTVVGGELDPALSLKRGYKYTFNINAPGHQFWILTTSTYNITNAYSHGITNNGTGSGILTFVVPGDAPDRLYYECPDHPGMAGVINISNVDGNSIVQSDTPPEDTSSLWYDTESGRLYVNYDGGWIDASPSPSISGLATETFVTTRGYITATSQLVNNTSTLTLNSNGTVTFPDGTTQSGMNITLPTSNGSPNSVSWTFNDAGIGSDTVRLEWNFLTTRQPDWWLGVNDATGHDDYFHFSSANQSIGYAPLAQEGNGLLVFGTSTHGGAGGVNDIELASISGDVYVRTNNNYWKFGTDGSLTFPDNTVQTTAFTGTGITVITPDDTEISGIATLVFTGAGVTASSVGNAVTLDISGGGAANTGDFIFTATDMSAPIGQPMTLSTYQSAGNKESKLTLSTSGISSLDVGNNLRVRVGNGTGFEQDWTFGADGSLRFPDNTLQTTAWNDTAFMASMATYDGPIVTNTATVGVGGLVVNGPVTFNSTFTFLGTATVISSNSGTFYGDVNGVGALYAGVAGFSPLPDTVIQSAANVNGYVQNNFQNINNGNQASTEWVATNNTGDDSNNYIDVGIAGSAWDGSQVNSVGTAAGPSDSWVYAQGTTSSSVGGNLVLGTIKNGKAVKILVGDRGANSVVATFTSSTGLTLNTGTIQFADGTIQSTAAVSFNTGTLVRAAVSATTAISATNWTGGTVTGVSTFTSNLTVNGTITRSGNISTVGVSSFNGVGLVLPAATYTDTTSSGAVTWGVAHAIGIPTFAATSATSFGTAAALYIAGDPVGGTNGTVNAATSYSLYVGGKAFFGQALRVGAIQSQGGAANIQTGNNGPTLNGSIITLAGVTNVTNTTPSTSTTTGALVVSGGVGIAGTATVWGNVVTPNLPAFRVVGSGGSASTGTTLTSANFTVDYNQGGYLNTSTGIFTAPVAGIYQVNIVGRAFSNTGPAAQIIVYKNTTTSIIMVEWAANTTVNHMGGSTAVKLAAGDTLKAVVALGTISFDINDNWSVAFLG